MRSGAETDWKTTTLRTRTLKNGVAFAVILLHAIPSAGSDGTCHVVPAVVASERWWVSVEYMWGCAAVVEKWVCAVEKGGMNTKMGGY